MLIHTYSQLVNNINKAYFDVDLGNGKVLLDCTEQTLERKITT